MTDEERRELVEDLHLWRTRTVLQVDAICKQAADEIERLAKRVEELQSGAEPFAWQKVREVLETARLCLKSRDQSPQEARVREAIEGIIYTAPPRPDASAGLIEAAEIVKDWSRACSKDSEANLLDNLEKQLRARAADKMLNASGPKDIATGWPLPETPEHIRRFAEKLRARAADRSGK